MNARIDIYHDRRRVLKDSDTFPVRIRVTYNRQTKYFPTGIEMSAADFEKYEKGKYLTGAMAKNADKIKKFRSAFQDAAELTVPFSFERLKLNLNPVRRKSSKDVFSLFQSKIDNLLNSEKVSTAKSYTTCFNVFKELSGKKELAFHDVSIEWLNECERKLSKKGNSPGTIGIYMRYLRHLFNVAITEGYVDSKLYPFGVKGYKIKSPQRTKKALSKSELILLINYWKEALGNEQKALDYWFFSLFSNGINMRDILELKWKQLKGNTITFRRTKTKATSSNQAEITVHLTNFHNQILERLTTGRERNGDNYIFPDFQNADLSEDQKYYLVMDRRKFVGKRVKAIGKSLGITTDIKFETARHTFANSLKYLNVSTSVIADFMGHSSTSTTDKYLASIQTDEEKKVINNFVGSLTE